MVAMLKYLLNSNHYLPLLENPQTIPNTQMAVSIDWLPTSPLLSVDILLSLSALLSRYRWVASIFWHQILLSRLSEHCHGSSCHKQYPPSWPGYTSEYSWQNLVSESHLIHEIGLSWYYGGYYHHQPYDHHCERGKHSLHNLVPEHAFSTVWYCRMIIPILLVL